ncbi:MAG: hypothetical protein KAS74_03925 [Methanosarcinales archaeon]|nr:hypothetical protein [Methanosarcinales archaeon]
MTGKSIGTDEKPCPLTRGEWLALLAAESQAKFGYEHLAVAVLLAACSSVLIAYIAGMTYIATRFESSGDPIQLVWIVVFCVMLALFYRKFPVKSLVNMFKEEYENSKTIEEIISGDLTDSDEIRKQYYERRKTPDQM